MIECSLMEMKTHAGYLEINQKKKKYGLYSGCCYYGIKGFGNACWVVLVNIDIDNETYLSEDEDINQVTKDCIEYLNTPPKSKYGKKRKRKPIYGNFREEPYRAYLKEKDSKKYIQAMLVVENRKRKHFWGEGQVIKYRKRR